MTIACVAGAGVCSLADVTPLTIAFVHFPGRLARLAAAREGHAPTEFLFGAVELERAGHAVVHLEVDPRGTAGPLATRVLDRLAAAGHLPPHVTPPVLKGTHALLPQLRAVDVVVGTTTPTALGLAVWKRAGRLRTPLVGILSGIVNRPWRRTRRLTTAPLLRRMETVLYGDGELAAMLGLDSRLADRVHVLGFGVDTRFWCPGGGASGRQVFAIGNDGARDWETLVRAAPSVTAPIHILTGHSRPAELPANVTWEPADWHRSLFSDEEILARYRRAAAVVVPLRDVPQPSGQSVTLQAMACGRPVVLTRTRGLWDRSLLDGSNVLLVPPSDPGALAESIGELLDDPSRADALGAAARRHVVATAGIDGFAERLERVCRTALQRRSAERTTQ